MKWILTVVGVLLVLIGGVWVLQGIGVLPGSFMSGQIQWAYNGAIAAAIGIGTLLFAHWPRRKAPPR